MAKALVDDELWTLIEPLIPVKPRRKTHPGRKPVDNRKALTGILFVLKTGMNAIVRRVDRPRHLATDPRVVPGQAAWGGLAGLVASVGRLQFGEGPAGRRKCGPNPTVRGHQGSKLCVLIDDEGVPLVMQTVPADQHDITSLLPCNVVVRDVGQGKISIEVAKPSAMMQILGNQTLISLSQNADQTLARALEKI